MAPKDNETAIVLIGGGGHCRVVIAALRRIGPYKICGIVDATCPLGSVIDGVEVIGRDEDLKRIYQQGISHAFLSLGSVKSSKAREKLAKQLSEIGFSFPVLVDPLACLSVPINLRPGVFVAAGVILQPGVDVGEHAIINTGAVVEHDSVLGDFVHVAPGAVLGGSVSVGEGSLIGLGARVIPGVQIGARAVVGAGAVVIEDVVEGTTVVGVPARKR